MEGVHTSNRGLLCWLMLLAAGRTRAREQASSRELDHRNEGATAGAAAARHYFGVFLSRVFLYDGRSTCYLSW